MRVCVPSPTGTWDIAGGARSADNSRVCGSCTPGLSEGSCSLFLSGKEVKEINIWGEEYIETAAVP